MGEREEKKGEAIVLFHEHPTKWVPDRMSFKVQAICSLREIIARSRELFLYVTEGEWEKIWITILASVILGFVGSWCTSCSMLWAVYAEGLWHSRKRQRCVLF